MARSLVLVGRHSQELVLRVASIFKLSSIFGNIIVPETSGLIACGARAWNICELSGRFTSFHDQTMDGFGFDMRISMTISADDVNTLL